MVELVGAADIGAERAENRVSGREQSMEGEVWKPKWSGQRNDRNSFTNLYSPNVVVV